LYLEQTGISSKIFIKINERIVKFKEDNFLWTKNLFFRFCYKNRSVYRCVAFLYL
jgi:hypothetical protein